MGATTLRVGIRLAQETDFADILAMQGEHWVVPQLAAGVTGEELRERGFLVHKLCHADLELFLNSSNAVIFVAERYRYGSILGYAVGCTLAFHMNRHPYWPHTIESIDQADRVRLVAAENIWYFRQQAVARKYQGRGVSGVFSDPVRWFALGQGCTSMIGEIVEAPYYNEASFRTVSKNARIIGKIPDLYECVWYTWAVVETPLL